VGTAKKPEDCPRLGRARGDGRGRRPRKTRGRGLGRVDMGKETWSTGTVGQERVAAAGVLGASFRSVATGRLDVCVGLFLIVW